MLQLSTTHAPAAQGRTQRPYEFVASLEISKILSVRHIAKGRVGPKSKISPWVIVMAFLFFRASNADGVWLSPEKSAWPHQMHVGSMSDRGVEFSEQGW